MPPRRSEIIRRRALALLVVTTIVVVLVSVLPGPFATVRSGAGSAGSAIGHGAAATAKPITNLIGWIGDSISAKGSVKDADEQRDAARLDAIRAQTAAAQNPELQGLYDLDRQPYDLAPYKPVIARVTVRSPIAWYEHVSISKGTIDGIRTNMPVVASDGRHAGLIGKVTRAQPTSAVVQLITDSRFAVGAVGVGDIGAGTLTPAPGRSRDLTMDVSTTALHEGDMLVTQGTTSKRTDLDSLYPRDLPVAQITAVDASTTTSTTLHAAPLVDSRRIHYVQVLTVAHDHNR